MLGRRWEEELFGDFSLIQYLMSKVVEPKSEVVQACNHNTSVIEAGGSGV